MDRHVLVDTAAAKIAMLNFQRRCALHGQETPRLFYFIRPVIFSFVVSSSSGQKLLSLSLSIVLHVFTHTANGKKGIKGGTDKTSLCCTQDLL